MNRCIEMNHQTYITLSLAVKDIKNVIKLALHGAVEALENLLFYERLLFLSDIHKRFIHSVNDNYEREMRIFCTNIIKKRATSIQG